MSQLSDKIYSLLKEIFPQLKIKKEYFVVYQGQKLFVDFFIPSLAMAIEVHGSQHDHFVQHFHSTAEGWRQHQKRDRLKTEWAMFAGITYVVVRKSNFPSTKEDLLALIRSSQSV